MGMGEGIFLIDIDVDGPTSLLGALALGKWSCPVLGTVDEPGVS